MTGRPVRSVFRPYRLLAVLLLSASMPPSTAAAFDPVGGIGNLLTRLRGHASHQVRSLQERNWQRQLARNPQLVAHCLDGKEAPLGSADNRTLIHTALTTGRRFRRISFGLPPHEVLVGSCESRLPGQRKRLSLAVGDGQRWLDLGFLELAPVHSFDGRGKIATRDYRIVRGEITRGWHQLGSQHVEHAPIELTEPVRLLAHDLLVDAAFFLAAKGDKNELAGFLRERLSPD